MMRLAAVPLFVVSLSVPAADLSIALGGDVTSMDPHFHNLTPNNNIGAHVFDTLVMKEPGGRIKPGLAESWRAVDDTTWEFRLRKGVRFHDGSIFTAADVVSAIAAQAKVQLDKKQVHVDHIKTLGSHTVTASLHHDVEGTFTVEVVAK